MLYEELLEVLRETNNERENPVTEAVLEEILALVIKNPLEEDRKRCQSQIELVLVHRSKGGKK